MGGPSKYVEVNEATAKGASLTKNCAKPIKVCTPLPIPQEAEQGMRPGQRSSKDGSHV